MKRLLRDLMGGAVLMTLATATLAQGINDRAELESFVDGMVKSLMKANNAPSGVVAIANRDGLILAKGFGYKDVDAQEPMDPHTTLVRPGSVSKLATWVAVMQQVERGSLDLDADVNTYLDDFQIADTYNEPVTLRHIMTHTAGFEDGGMGYLIIDDPDRAMPLSEAMARYQPARVNPPGKQTAYSNYATALAGLLVERVSGLPFNRYLQENIFDPLGMQRSTFEEPLPESLAADMAGSYKLDAGRYADQPFEIISSFAPAGSQSATATDMVRFGRAILNGGELDGNRILAEDTTNQMLTRAFSHDERMMGMALGFYEADYNGFRVVGHGGDTQWFHSFLGIDQVNGLTFFVSFGGTGGSTVRTLFTGALYDQYFPSEPVRPQASDGAEERAAKFAGTYGFWRTNFSTLEKLIRSGTAIKVAPAADGAILLALGGGGKQYLEVEDNLFRELNPGVSLAGGMSAPLLAFQTDGQGAVTGFVIDGLPFMSLRKLSVHETPGFNMAMVAFCVLVFLVVVIGRWYRRADIRGWHGPDRVAANGAFYAALVNLVTVIAGALAFAITADSLFTEVPALLKAWLVLPIVATVAGFYAAWCGVGVWRNGALAGVWARIRYSVIAACALFMCWFYYFWNILGYQYL
ncbi:MAG: serine hydrolase domain-containing protein [Xanthomonadales bacterium]|nr:serine hydrolase domain-containing protein [Xanthomonadales bacterium]